MITTENIKQFKRDSVKTDTTHPINRNNYKILYIYIFYM